MSERAVTSGDESVTVQDNHTNNRNQQQHQQQHQQKQQQQTHQTHEYNPRWKGYVYMAIASLVNFASISDIPRLERVQSSWVAGMAFGVSTFALSILILLHDRSQKCVTTFHYTKASNGYFEGYVLLFCVVWWVGG